MPRAGGVGGDNGRMDEKEGGRLEAAIAELEALDPADSPEAAAKLVDELSTLLDAEDDDSAD